MWALAKEHAILGAWRGEGGWKLEYSLTAVWTHKKCIFFSSTNCQTETKNNWAASLTFEEVPKNAAGVTSPKEGLLCSLKQGPGQQARNTQQAVEPEG